MTLPALTVLLDDGTGTFPLNITSKVLALDGYEVSRGRSDWIGAATAGELSLTLNNSDGRFTPGSTILGSPSPIKVDQPIRVVESFGGFGTLPFGMGPFGGSLNRFTGYVKSWPVSWPAVVPTFATVQVTATDAQARAERRILKSMLEEEILLRTPSAYYTCGEAEGSTSAGDTSGNQAPVLSEAGSGTAVTFGQGTGPADGMTTATLAGGKYLYGSTLTPGSSYSELVAMSRSTPPAAVEVLKAVGSELLILETSGKVSLYTGVSLLFTGLLTPVARSASSVCDGGVHLLGFSVQAAVGYQLFVDGATTIAADVTAGTTPALYTGLSVGGTDALLGTTALTGNVSHVAHFNGAVLTSTQVSGVWAVIAGTETSTARIARLASYAGIPVGTFDPSLTTVPAQATSGQSAQEAIQEVVDAELGLVFIDGFGNLTFHNRDHVATKTIPDLILDAQYVTPDVQPMTDDQQIVNYFEAATAATGATTVARDLTSEDAHGRYPTSQTYLVTTDAEALTRANWIVSKFAEPSARYGTLTINLYKMTAELAASVAAALDLDCWLRVTSMASQNPGGTVADVVVQGWQASVTGESWEITCNVVSHSLYQVALWDVAGSLWDSAVWSV